MKISELIENVTDLRLVSGADAEISAVEYDSRKCTAGSLFVAVEGLVSDGHAYIDQVVAANAAAVVVSEKRAASFSSLPCAVIAAADTRVALSKIAAFFYGEVSKHIPVIGITGTNGKTSTTYMMEAILSHAGYTPGVIGTVSYRWKGKEIDAPNTTPESKDLHELLHNMHADGVDVVVMEVSSHGLDLGRVDEIEFTGGVFTNLTRDHLDYHKTFEEYFKAKQILFSLLEKSPREGKFACINSDDPYGAIILSGKDSFSYPMFSFGMNQSAQFHPKPDSVAMTVAGSDYAMVHGDESVNVHVPIGSKFSLYNSLAAFSAMSAFGIKPADIAAGLATLKSVPGRFDRIASSEGFSVIVDYAHTNDAMEKLLSSVKELNPAEVITVFGCGGDRDRTKRPLMGEIAGRYSDTVIVTSDNPRTENPDAIIADIMAGMQEYAAKTRVIADRESAIREAVQLAKKGSIVVLAGKGHENYQIIGKEKRHFDDREIAAHFIAQRGGR